MNRPNLTRNLVLEAPEQVADGAGGFSETWAPLGSLWAEIAPRTGREATGDAGTLAVNSFRITVRAAPLGASNRPEAGQRFRMGKRLFRILAVTEREPAAMYLACETREEVAS